MIARVIYIMGYAHSGSTLLDMVLSNHPNITSVGEVNKLYRSGWTNGMTEDVPVAYRSLSV